MIKFAGEFFAALRFLTILPLPWFQDLDSSNFPLSVKYFALVGILIGLGASLLASLLSFLPHPLMCCAILLYLSLISGFLHLDGFADTADGFLSHRSKDEMLAIMRDSRSGAMGVISLFFLLLIKYFALFSLPSDAFIGAIFFLPLAGRVAIVFTMAYLPYARETKGLGQLFYSHEHRKNCLASVGILIIAGLMVDVGMTVMVVATIAIVGVIFAIICKRLIDGYTGDTLGALCEITETAVAIMLTILLIHS